jgi:hypothetical protein
MINSNLNDGNSSVVKFGSWDPSALASGQELNMIRTTSSRSWSVAASEFRLNGVNFLTGIEKEIDISPHLPYLYMPDAEWSQYAYHLNDLFGAQVDCAWSGNYCRFKGACQTYLGQHYLPLEIELKDRQGGHFAMSVDLNHYLVDSDNFGEAWGEYCYIPLFRSYHLKLQNTWFLGSIFMNDYIYVFDNTPYTEKMEDYNLVGFGLKNHAAVQSGVEA